MKRKAGIGVVVLVFLCIIILWASSIVFVPMLLKIVEMAAPICDPKVATCPEYVGKYGSVGDLFGAVNALFSGLALASIALTLWVDSKSRREAKKPFLVASKSTGGDWVVEMPKTIGAGTSVPFVFDMAVFNQGQEVALNVSICVSVQSRNVSENYELQVPLVPSQVALERVTLQIKGEDLEFVLGKLTSRQNVCISVVTKYTSMDDVTWKTCVVYEVVLSEERRDLDLINLIRAETWRDEWQDGAKVPLNVQIKRGSWSYGVSR